MRTVVLPQAEARALDLLHMMSSVRLLHQLSHPTTASPNFEKRRLLIAFDKNEMVTALDKESV